MSKQLTRRELLFGRRRFADDESGATAIEYGLIASAIALVIVGSLQTTGLWTQRKFHCIRAAIQGFDPGVQC
ncbi:Flp family type IVb pilin [Zhengella sp. ZM62]|uniref:Flp family type IVb pilin n=1 Tax=Zhengella sedimenti TaxID=3390035 RepID=UPI0039757B46